MNVKYFSTVLCLGVILVTSVYAKSKQVSVNGVVITQAQIDRELKSLLPMASFHSNVTDDKKKELEKDAVDHLINKQLLFQHAVDQGYTASVNDVTKAEKEIIQGFKDRKSFERALAARGLSLSEFRTELQVEATIAKLYDAKIKTPFTDDDLKEYYQKNRHKFKEPEKADVDMIYTKNDPTIKEGGKIARKRAEEAMGLIKSGTPFDVVAAKYSNDMTRIKGGKLGLIHRGRIDNPEADRVAFSLKKGETSAIVETDVGCFILRVNERKAPNQLPFEAVKDKLASELSASREEAKMDKMLESLKKQAKIIR